MWQENVDCHPILSRHQVLEYIVKYASKAERRSESYHQMLTRVAGGSRFGSLVLSTYRSFLAKRLVECKFGAQETCHLLLKLPPIACSWKFFS